MVPEKPGDPKQPKDAAVSHPPSSEQAHDEDGPVRTPGLGPNHQHRRVSKPVS